MLHQASVGCKVSNPAIAGFETADSSEDTAFSAIFLLTVRMIRLGRKIASSLVFQTT
ncbi:hypothetical protein JYT87_00220 [Nitrospira defluvii]|nr:hypothetical protein [Nitrospira defluvii]